MEVDIIFSHHGNRLVICYRAYKRDGKYMGHLLVQKGEKTKGYIDSLSEKEYECFWDDVDKYAQSKKLPF